jgi:hypothetical protein
VQSGPHVLQSLTIFGKQETSKVRSRDNVRGRGRAALFGYDKLEQMAAAEGVSRVCVRRMNQNRGDGSLDSLTLLISVRVN